MSPGFSANPGNGADSRGGGAAWFALTAFSGAFLLFFVEPLAGKELLPLVGGSFMVWAIALAFFQGTLLAAYLGVHLLFGRRVSPPRSAGLLGLLAAAVGWGVWSGGSPPPPPDGPFTWWELQALARMIGAPFLALATCQLALQRWWSRSGGSPDEGSFIFVASNAGSLAGLLAFPLVGEPRWASDQLWQGWRWGTVLWTGFMVICYLRSASGSEPLAAAEPGGSTNGTAGNPQPESHPSNPPLTRNAGGEADGDLAREFESGLSAPQTQCGSSWVLPALAGSALLSATTNLLTMDVASFPLLWVIPLAVYLLTWIKAFSRAPSEDSRWFAWFPEILAGGFILGMINQLGFALDAGIRIAGLLAILYSLAYACHAALRLRLPADPGRLTSYYLAMTAGGAAGTALVAFVAPRVFLGLGEYPLAVFLAAWAVWDEVPWRFEEGDPFLVIRLGGVALVVFGLPALFQRGMPDTGSFLVTATAGAMFYLTHVLREAARIGRHRVLVAGAIAVCLLGLDAYGGSGAIRQAFRNGYGLYKVFDTGNVRHLQMGSTFHGHEMLEGPARGRPLFYYHPATPIGGFLSRTPHTWHRVGVVGLGAGTLAAYALPGERMDFFELDPDGVDMARRWFSYLASATAEIAIIPGDGRLSLRRAAPGTYDLLLLDAFSSDAIPIHLLTLEAIGEYRRALREDGLLLFHISNRHLDLRPLLVAAARSLGLEVRLAENPDPADPLVYPTRWVAMGTGAGLARHLQDLPEWRPPASDAVPVQPWADRFSSLWSVWWPLREPRIEAEAAPR